MGVCAQTLRGVANRSPASGRVASRHEAVKRHIRKMLLGVGDTSRLV